MKAAAYTRYGPPAVVQIIEVDKPKASHDELLVKVHATTVDRTNCRDRAAKPFILGASGFSVGSRVPHETVGGMMRPCEIPSCTANCWGSSRRGM